MDTREAYAVRRAIRLSMLAGLVLAVIAFFTILSGDSNLQLRSYGAFGVFVFSTVVLGALANIVIIIQQKITRYRHRWRG